MMRSLAVVMLMAASAGATPPTSADAVRLAARLATALEHDVPLGDLADPKEGVHVWQRPGEDFIEKTQFHAADKPSRQLAKAALLPYYKQNYAKSVAKSLRYSLAHLDVDPRTPDAPAYQVDCTRYTVQAERATLSHLVLVRNGDVKVTFVVRGEKLYVSNIYLDDACEL